MVKLTTNLKLNPLYEYKYENKDIKFEKLVLLKDKQFVASSKNLVLLFNYLIDDEKTKIDLIKSNNKIKDIIEIIIIENNEKEMIAVAVNKYIYFLDIPNLKIIKKIELKCLSKKCLFQLNSNELLIIDSVYYLKIIDLNKFQIKLIIKDYISSDYILNIQDGTIIISSFSGIKRYLIKNMQELNKLKEFNNNDDYYDYYETDYYSEQINYMIKLKDGRIVLCYQNGKIEIMNFILI